MFYCDKNCGGDCSALVNNDNNNWNMICTN